MDAHHWCQWEKLGSWDPESRGCLKSEPWTPDPPLNRPFPSLPIPDQFLCDVTHSKLLLSSQQVSLALTWCVLRVVLMYDMTIISINWGLFKSIHPHPCNHLHMPTDYRHTDKHLRLVMTWEGDRWTNGQTDAAKYFISLGSGSIKRCIKATTPRY